MNPRAIAALLLLKVIKEGHSLTETLSQLPEAFPHHTESGFVKAVCYDVLRWYFQFEELLKHLIKKPLKSKDLDIYLLLMVGLCQILYLRTSHHAAVTETVNAAKDLDKPWAKHFINAVLRNFLRQQNSLMDQLTPSAHYAHPNWLIQKLQHAWPQQWEDMLSANNMHPPLSLRVNLQKTSRADFLKKLLDAGIEAFTPTDSDVGIILKKPQNVLDLPGYDAGFFSVQDTSAQLAVRLLDLQKNLRVLDACAAPGGKTTHIVEYEPNLTQLIAVDVSEPRLKKAKENFYRLGLPDKVTWVVAEVEQTTAWWDGLLFDRILLDAPCSATGVIRRHPDIKVLRKTKDIASLAKQQLQLLTALWPLLAPGGILVYATCSVLPEENVSTIRSFLETHHDASEKKIEASWGFACDYGRQILPNLKDNMDGFYYAALRKS